LFRRDGIRGAKETCLGSCELCEDQIKRRHKPTLSGTTSFALPTLLVGKGWSKGRTRQQARGLARC
jgi:hypothetical protein